MTQCSQQQFEFAGQSRKVVAEFSGGTMSSDGGALLLRETDEKLNLVARLSQCFGDGRNQALVEHSVEQMLRQRVYALALGYEDLNDHDQLRHDPLLATLAGKADPESDAMASKSTLNRMELGNGMPDRYKKIHFWREGMDDLLIDVFLEAHSTPPQEIILDVDTTDFALHGKQEDRFFHGYYGHYCYLPLFVFCGDHVLCARLRPSNIGPAVGCRKEIQRIVERIRAQWATVRIILRADSGFCTDELMSWCEQHGVDFVFGMARNSRLVNLVAEALAQAQQQFEATGKPARVFVEFAHETVSGTWSQQRRVVAKAEHIDGKSNPRFVVTSLPADHWPKQELYERTYCARGDMENRIKEQFVLFADRVSASTLRANQLRLYLAVIGYTLMSGLRRIGLRATAMATAQVGTIRLKLFKIAALVRITVRKVWIRMATSYPDQALFSRVLHQLRQ